MKKNTLFVLLTLFLFSVVSCKNFLNGDANLFVLEQAMDYQQAPVAGIILTCDVKACKSMSPEAGIIENKKAGDSFELEFEETAEYYFEKWVAEPAECVSFENAEARNTTVTIVNSDAQITIKPVCHARKVLTVNFEGENGSTYPVEQKKYLSGEVFDISFSESVGFSFLNWSYSVESGEENPITLGSVDNIQTSVTVGELTKDGEITIIANCAKKPGIINYAPGQNIKGEPLNSIITVFFDKEMDESSIYFSDSELTELGVIDSEGALIGDYILLIDVERDNKCYGFQVRGDDDSIVYKNITIRDRDDSTQNYLKYYKSPRLDEAHKKLEIPTSYETFRLPVTKNILVTISSQMGTKVDEKIIHMEKDQIWSYFTANEEDINAPVVELSASAILNGNLSLLPTDTNQIVTSFNDFDYQKSIFLNENGKILFNGIMRDLESGVSYLSWTVNKLKIVNNGLERITAGTGYISKFTYAGAIASFYSDNSSNSGEIDLSSFLPFTKEAVGMYEVSVNVFDNCGNKSDNLNYYFYFDKYVSPVLNLTEKRIEDSQSTLSWIYDTNENDYERIEIYYDNEEKKDILLTQNSVVIDNLVPDHKYEYKAILFDKFGNSSQSVFVDNEPPAYKSLVYDHDVISKNTIQLRIDRPRNSEYKYTKIKLSDPEKYIIVDSTDNIIQAENNIITLKNTDSINNRFNTSFTVEDYDYSGNKVETVYEKKAEPEEGFYYYKDKFWSKAKIEGKDSDLLGQICYTSGNALMGNTVRIIALSNFKASANGIEYNKFYTVYPGAINQYINNNRKINPNINTDNKNNYKTISLKMASDGRANYDTMRNVYPELMKINTDTNPNQLIWPYLNELNKDIDLDNQQYFVWYIPSYVEMEYVLASRTINYNLPSSTYVTSSFGRSVSSTSSLTRVTVAAFAIKKASDGLISKVYYNDTMEPQLLRLMAQVPID